MARTDKWEHPTDGFHLCHRLERQARPAGRLVAVIAAELAEGAEPFDLVYEPVEPEPPITFDGYTPFHTDMPCGGYCRRCLLHDDPGGCLG